MYHKKTRVYTTSEQASPHCYGGIEGGRPKAGTNLRVPDKPCRGGEMIEKALQ